MPLIESSGSSGGGGGSGTVTNVSSADTSIVVTNPTTTPSLKVGTMDVLFTNEPPAASVPMNTQKLTGLAAGTTNGDSVRFEQVVKSGAVTAADTSIVVAGTGVAPTIATGTLDVIATNHPPAASVPMNTQKLTGLAAGTTNGDSVRFEQVVKSGAVTAADTSIVVAGTGVAPTIATGTLDVIATNHPPAAAWSNNSKRITAVSFATGLNDAAAFGQLVDLRAVGLGYQNWNMARDATSGASAPASQSLYAQSIWLPPGLTITGVVLVTVVAAAGTKPTNFQVGICSTTTMLQQSADVSGAAGVPFAATGETQVPFSSTYLTSASDSPTGLYYLLILQNGSYGTTQPTFLRGTTTVTPKALTGKTPVFGSLGTGQTVLPANAAGVTIGTAASQAFFVGAY